MIYNTRGIVLHKFKYAETGVIAKIYTETFGLQSYLIHSVRSKKSKTRIGLLQPLSLIDLVAYHKEKNGLQRLKEFSVNYLFSSIPYNIAKSSITLFIAEVLYKSIREEEANSSLFDYLFNTIQQLDQLKGNCADFHLLFLVKLSRYLGFFPGGVHSADSNYFDLKEGVFCSQIPDHGHYMQPELSKCLNRFLTAGSDSPTEGMINNKYRKPLLLKLIEFYKLHLSGMGEIKSHSVLETVME